MPCERFYIDIWDVTLVLPAKCASTSIKAAVQDVLHRPISEFAAHDIEPRGKVIAFVRNPFARIVSTYQNKIQTSREPYKGHPVNCKTRFSEFIDYITGPEEDNVHWSAMSPYIPENADFIFKLENAPAIWHELKKHIPIRFVSHKNQTNDKPKDPNTYRYLYSPTDRDKMEKYYYEDLKRFGYEF